METLISDIRCRMRSLLKRPGVYDDRSGSRWHWESGVNTAIFSVINAVLLRPLPHLEPARLVTFVPTSRRPDLADIERQSRTFSNFGGEVKKQPLICHSGQ